MLHRQYKYKFYLNMNHSVEMKGKQGQVHSHTWEISMRISMDMAEFVRFSEVEKYIDEILEVYQDKYLNSIEPFDVINPILENVCDYLYRFLANKLKEKGWELLMMEMSETPSRVYQVSGYNPKQ